MRIGIDIDNGISNFDEELLKEFLEHDKHGKSEKCIENNIEL